MLMMIMFIIIIYTELKILNTTKIINWGKNLLPLKVNIQLGFQLTKL